MDDQIGNLKRFAVDHDRPFFLADHGIGIPFGDGFDTYWYLPLEPWYFLTQQLLCLEDPLTLFHCLEERRIRVIDAMRRYLAKQKIVVSRFVSGQWVAMTQSGVTGDLSVGAWLTQRLMLSDDLAQVTLDLLDQSHVPTPSRKRVERHLSEYGQPFTEPDWQDHDGEPTPIPDSPLVVLGWMGLCKASQKDIHYESPEQLVAAAGPRGRIAQALLRFASRLPNVRASHDLIDGAMVVDFNDGRAEYSINPRSQKTRGLVRELGPEAAGEALADEYERLNADRHRVIHAVMSTLHANGYVVDFSLGGHYGRQHQEFTLDLGKPLTTMLESSQVQEVVRTLLAEQPSLAEEAIRSLDDDVVSDEPIKLEKRSLPPIKPEPWELPPVDAKTAGLLDKRVSTILKTYLDGESAFFEAYDDPLMYDASIDTWVTPEQWREIAERWVGDEYPRPDAALLLIDQGVDGLRDKLVKQLIETEPHDEVWDQEVEMVWRLRHEKPDLAAKWFNPDAFDDVPYAKSRAQLGDPVALQYQARRLYECEEDDEQTIPHLLAKVPREIHRVVNAEDLERWRRYCQAWAAQAWQWTYGGEHQCLAAAANMGWHEVGEILENNPYLLPGLLAPNDGDDPGLIFAKDLLLAWSKLAPSDFLQRVAAAGLTGDLRKLVTPYARRMTGDADIIAKHRKAFENSVSKWCDELKVVLANLSFV